MPSLLNYTIFETSLQHEWRYKRAMESEDSMALQINLYGQWQR